MADVDLRKLRYFVAVAERLHFGRAAQALHTRPDLTCSHVSDIPPGQVCLAWDATRHSRLIHDYAAIAADPPPVASQAEPDRSSPA